MVEHLLAKERVESSNLFIRFILGLQPLIFIVQLFFYLIYLSLDFYISCLYSSLEPFIIYALLLTSFFIVIALSLMREFFLMVISPCTLEGRLSFQI